MNVLAIVQARMGSQRFPGKSMALIDGRPMVAHVLERASRIIGVDQVVLTTPKTHDDRVLGAVAKRMGIEWWPDDHSDLLACFYRCAVAYHADVIVRITGDCPLLDPEGSSAVLRYFLDNTKVQYVSNVGPFTDGFDTEVFGFHALKDAQGEAVSVHDRHHVTPFIRQRPLRFWCETITPSVTPDGEKWSVDSEADLERIRQRYPGLRVPA